MRLKTMLLPALHTVCIGVVLFLAGFIVREKQGDGEADLQREVDISMGAGLSEIRAERRMSLIYMEKLASDYPGLDTGRGWRGSVQVKAKSDSLCALIDSLGLRPDAELLHITQQKLSAFRSDLWALTNYYSNSEDKSPKFEPADWLFKSWKNGSSWQFATVLTMAKMNVYCIEHAAMNRLFQRASVVTCGFPNPLHPVISFPEATYSVGDTIEAEIWASRFLILGDEVTLRIDSKALPHENGVASFSFFHDKPGNYPLHFSVEQRDRLTDSVRVFEKTYWLRVRE